MITDRGFAILFPRYLRSKMLAKDFLRHPLCVHPAIMNWNSKLWPFNSYSKRNTDVLLLQSQRTPVLSPPTVPLCIHQVFISKVNQQYLCISSVISTGSDSTSCIPSSQQSQVAMVVLCICETK